MRFLISQRLTPVGNNSRILYGSQNNICNRVPSSSLRINSSWRHRRFARQNLFFVRLLWKGKARSAASGANALFPYFTIVLCRQHLSGLQVCNPLRSRISRSCVVQVPLLFLSLVLRILNAESPRTAFQEVRIRPFNVRDELFHAAPFPNDYIPQLQTN